MTDNIIKTIYYKDNKFKQLKGFVAVYETGSLTKAAEKITSYQRCCLVTIECR